MQVQEGNCKNDDFSTNPSLNLKIFTHSNVYLLHIIKVIAMSKSPLIETSISNGVT